jgi:hypothetical protein
MNIIETTIADDRAKPAAKNSNPSRFFYLAAALVLLAVVLTGFQQFYLHGRSVGGQQISPQILTLVVTHGVLMSTWIVLFTVQPFLIVTRHRRWHMMLGRFATILAVAIIVVGILVAIESARLHPALGLWGLTGKQFMAIPIIGMLIFFVFVSLGVLARRRPEIHRSMMLLATLSLVEAATGRIFLLHFYEGSIWAHLFGPALPLLVLGALFLVVRSLLTRRFDRWFAVGYAGLFLAELPVMFLARSEAWDRFATFLLR